jgi:hypothetical protein
MVEIGPSAGFNLNWDRYAYTYRRGGDVVLRRGASGALLALESELRGDGVPPLSEAMPRVASRLGLELNPVNLQDPEDRLWQKALVFADLTHRLARLDGAIATAIANPVRILFGDALENLEGIVRALPTDGIPVVYHSFVTYQFSPAMRDRLRAILLELSKSRPLYRVSIEWEGTLHPVTVERYEAGRHDAVVLGDCNPHGAWIEWKGAQARATP